MMFMVWLLLWLKVQLKIQQNENVDTTPIQKNYDTEMVLIQNEADVMMTVIRNWRQYNGNTDAKTIPIQQQQKLNGKSNKISMAIK